VTTTQPRGTGTIVQAHTVTSAQMPTGSTQPTRIPRAVITTAEKSLLSIGCGLPGGQFQPQGTAWMVARPRKATLTGGGSAITASHVIASCTQGGLIQAYGGVRVSPVQSDVTHDLALLSVSGEPEASLPVEAAPPRVGEQVALLGLAQQQFELTQGMIGAVTVAQRLTAEGSVETLRDAILVRTSVIHGETGGPAIDAAGRVVGVIEGGDQTGAGAVLTPVSDLPAGATQPPASTTTTTQTQSSQSSATALTPGDHNSNDPNAGSCSGTMEIGPHADCAAAQQVAQHLQEGKWAAPGSDTVTKNGGPGLTFHCSVVGRDTSQAAQPSIYRCVRTGDAGDWFEFEFT
jgi:hypothetical protein